MTQKSITIFDPGIKDKSNKPSNNLGDLIIQEAVSRELHSVFQDCCFLNLSTHEYPNLSQLLQAIKNDYMFVGGTNLLGSHLRKYKQWKLSLIQSLLLQRTILIGVGWQQYQVKPCLYSRISYKSVLSSRYTHSVRDSYTEMQLKRIGIKNVINTGCPTMWPFQDFDFSRISSEKSDTALIMLTDYRKNPELDRRFIDLVLSSYKEVIFWPQGLGDEEYILELFTEKDRSIRILERSFKSFQEFLESSVSFDYLGTRLHGGIKCLLSSRRSLIIEVDNRAKEIGKDTCLPTVKRDDFEKMRQWIEGSNVPKIVVNTMAINKWKSQFSEKVCL